MKRRSLHLCFATATLGSLVAAGCSDPTDTSLDAAVTGTGPKSSDGAPSSQAGAPSSVTTNSSTSGSGDSPTHSAGGARATGGAGGAGPIPDTGGGAGASAIGGSAGTASAAGGAVGEAGATSGGNATSGTSGSEGGSAGNGVGGGFVGGDGGELPAHEPIDCGANGTALEDHGPPSNRVNYVIVGDGYGESDLEAGGTLDQHLEAAMAKRFSDPIGQPYLRYRSFVNICVIRVPSGPICGESEFGCCGDDESRLANCDNAAVNSAISDNLPASFEVDWRAVVLNGSNWWNSGGTLMMWSGGNRDAGGAALHEGGHGHNFISDEYGNCEQGRVSREATYGVNISLSDGETGGRWDDWLGYEQDPGTGTQTIIACEGGSTWRPTQNSMMNSLFGDDPDTSYNAVSREKIVMDIWRVVERPYDAVIPEAGDVTNPTMLTVAVIDPEVIQVDWALDGEIIAMDGGPTYDVAAAGLAPGSYTVTARAFDDAGEDLVRQVPGDTFNRQYWGAGEMGHSDATVTWTVRIE